MPDPSDPDIREARLFRNNRSQAVRIPREFELPGERVAIRREGRGLVLEPIDAPGLAALLDGWEPLDEDWPEIDDPPSEPENVL